jgi:S-sulfosulfanyl-L-cysteine sulfohydrolase
VYRKAGGYDRIANLLRQIREEAEGRVFFADCGDTFHGTYPQTASDGQALIPVMNALGIDAMTMHWEFAFGPKRWLELAGQLNYPPLAINIYDQRSGKRLFAPYLIKEVGGLNLGVIGIASNIIDKTMPPAYGEGLRFTLGKEELPGVVAQVRSEKADLVVVISHIGLPQDLLLMSEVPGVDICLSSHTHNRLSVPILAENTKTIVIQSGKHGSWIGRLDLEVASGKVVNFRHELIEVAESVSPDPTVQGIIRQQMGPYDGLLSKIVGRTQTDLNRETMLESTMDTLLDNAILEAADAQVAFSNGWRFGAPIPAGEVSEMDVWNIMPFDGPISLVDLTGSEILRMMEENLESAVGYPAYKQMGGYTMRSAGVTMLLKIENPMGSRVQAMFVGEAKVKLDAVYRAAFLTPQAVPLQYGRNRQDMPVQIHAALLDYFQRHQPVRAELPRRIRLSEA